METSRGEAGMSSSTGQRRRVARYSLSIDPTLPTYSHVFGEQPSTNRTERQARRRSMVPRAERDDPPPAASIHEVHLRNSRGHPWVSLRVGHSNSSSSGVPLFEPGDEIHGSVDLDIPEPKGIKEISLTFRGNYRTMGDGRAYFDGRGGGESFISLPITLWKASTGSPSQHRIGDSTATAFNYSSPSPGSNKFLGRYTFVFMIQVPLRVVGQDSSSGSDLAPPSFRLTNTPTFVAYEIVVKLKGGVLSSPDILYCPVEVTPIRQPDAPSRLRREAYHSGSLPPDPDSDPDGWIVGRPSHFTTKLSQTLDIDLRCTLSLGKPLTYCRGATIPVHLKVVSNNTTQQYEDALDLLTRPSSISICLVRRIVVGQAGSGQAKKGDIKTGSNQTVTPLAMAVCWSERRTSQVKGRRSVWGEIKLAPDLIPSFEFRDLRLEYIAYLLPFAAAGIASAASTATLCDIPVGIVAGRVTARSYIPRGSVEPPLVNLSGNNAEIDDPLEMLMRQGAITIRPYNVVR